MFVVLIAASFLYLELTVREWSEEPTGIPNKKAKDIYSDRYYSEICGQFC